MKATSFATKAIRSGAPLALALLSSRAAFAAPEPTLQPTPGGATGGVFGAF
jgi:hypothetical protein